MSKLFLLGFLMGVKHALESDHLAVVASLSARADGLRATMTLGMVWGLGHTLTLLTVGGAVLWLDMLIPHELASAAELAVGVVLIVLGAGVLRRVLRRGGPRRGGAATQGARGAEGSGQPAHGGSACRARREFPLPALLVGLLHGLAGSAVLVVIALQAVDAPWVGMSYIVLFGAGSLVGMALLVTLVSVPLRCTRDLPRLNAGLQGMIGLLSIALGFGLLAETGPLVLAAG